MHKVSIVGTGNVAWHLAQGLDQAEEVEIIEVYGRNRQAALQLCEHLYEAELKFDLDFSDSPAEILLLVVSDSALTEVIHSLTIPEHMMVAHTSGTEPLEIFKGCTFNHGVFYPLQTFSKAKPLDLTQVPFCVEGNNEATEQLLWYLALQLSSKVYRLNSEQRKVLHIGAVIASNFTNYLLGLAKDVLEKKSIPFELLKPLIQETFEKALFVGPKKAQTGPAFRKDLPVIQKHLAYLEYDPDAQKTYELLTHNILKAFS